MSKRLRNTPLEAQTPAPTEKPLAQIWWDKANRNTAFAVLIFICLAIAAFKPAIDLFKDWYKPAPAPLIAKAPAPPAAEPIKSCSIEAMLGQWKCNGNCRKDHDISDVYYHKSVLMWSDGEKSIGPIDIDFKSLKVKITFDKYPDRPLMGTLHPSCRLITFEGLGNTASKL